MRKIVSAVILFCGFAGPALADGHAADGEKVFKKCAACHAVGENAKNKIGPEQNELLGRTAGGLESFSSKYSTAMKAAGDAGLIWTEDTLKEFLASPRTYVKGTKMAFVGLKTEQEIEDVVAYLATFSPDYVPAEESHK